jgi:quinoprotein glucose dehydrogenase
LIPSSLGRFGGFRHYHWDLLDVFGRSRRSGIAIDLDQAPQAGTTMPVGLLGGKEALGFLLSPLLVPSPRGSCGGDCRFARASPPRWRFEIGAPNNAGGVVTAPQFFFNGAAIDDLFRPSMLKQESGSGRFHSSWWQAMPMTYEAGGRHLGHQCRRSRVRGTPIGDCFIAYV